MTMSTQTDTIRKALDVIWKELDAISGLPSYAHVAVERARRIDKARDQITGIVSELDAQPSAPTVDEVMDVVKQWGERYYYEGYLSDLRARLTKLLTNP